LEHARVKGKAEPVKPYKVLSPREEPIKTRRLSGLRAELIGRRAEMMLLNEAIEKLKEGKGRSFPFLVMLGQGRVGLSKNSGPRFMPKRSSGVRATVMAYAQNILTFP